MKLQIIETPEYILAVSDKENKEGDLCIDMNGKIFKHENHFPISIGQRKIIAYQPKGNALELDLPLLPQIVVEDDVVGLSTKATEGQKFANGQHEEIVAQIYFRKGYKAATKVYSEEDLREAIEYAYNKGVLEIDISIDEIISQSLKQPKTPKWFVAETVCDQCLDDETVDSCYCNFGNYKTELKTTTINGKTYLVGTYLYE
jgi:hypothetical protein